MSDERSPNLPQRPPRRLEDLDFASQFVVWATRQWIGARAAGGERASRRLAEALAVARVPGALEPLDALLATLACHAGRRLDFRAAGDLQLGRDEAQLLWWLESLQRQPADPRRRDGTGAGTEYAAALVALQWIGASTARLLVARLARLAHELAAGGLWVGAHRAAGARSRARPAPAPVTGSARH